MVETGKRNKIFPKVQALTRSGLYDDDSKQIRFTNDDSAVNSNDDDDDDDEEEEEEDGNGDEDEDGDEDGDEDEDEDGGSADIDLSQGTARTSLMCIKGRLNSQQESDINNVVQAIKEYREKLRWCKDSNAFLLNILYLGMY
jgi:ABC-type Zn2+ transport system substrate-binding protein/surface adhesin